MATSFGFLDQDRGRNRYRNRKDHKAIVHEQFDGYRTCIGFNGVNRIDTDPDSDPDAEDEDEDEIFKKPAQFRKLLARETNGGEGKAFSLDKPCELNMLMAKSAEIPGYGKKCWLC